MALQTARYLVASYDKLLKKEVYSEKDKNDIDNRKEVSRVEEEGDERMSIELRKREIKEGL
tara:strand:+ start:187 stop:369 length:183 start_codon:yes stop_codon:yes gene_type:complete